MKENGGVHRCAVASITVKAPVCEVWKVLTSYESLPEYVPNTYIIIFGLHCSDLKEDFLNNLL